MNQALIILASASPRRAQLLEQLGISFLQQPAHIDESPEPGEAPAAQAQRLSAAKCEKVLASRDDSVVLGSDTVVALDQQVFGKPHGQTDHARMFTALAGKTHSVYTAVTLMTSHHSETLICTSRVRLRLISASETARYWHTGEPCDKAGGYAIQGFGAVFVAHLEGSYSGVMGLPLFETAQLLRKFDLPFWTSKATS